MTTPQKPETAQRQEDENGTFNCPICGHDKPHGHTNETIEAYRADQIRADGWTSSVHKMPSKFGYYLIKDFKFPAHESPRYDAVKILKNWRRGSWGDAPEVAEYHPSESPYTFTLLYAPYANDRFQASRLPVMVSPKYWRELP